MRATRALAVVCGVVSVLVSACGSGASSETAAPARGAADAVAAGAVGIYDDALLPGWSDWSWGSTRNLAATSPVASGTRSLAVTFQAWGGVYFRRTAGSVAGMATLELSANGGTAAGNRVEVRAVQGSTELSNVMLATYCTGGTIPANAWTRCRIPLSALAPAGGTIDGIILQSIDGTARPTMYLDQVILVPAAPAAPAGVAATASSDAVSLSWGAASGATGYDVLRAPASAGPFTKLTSSPQAATTYRDASVTAGSTYWYQVTASNTAGTSAPSAPVSATVPAGTAPTSVPIYADALASGWSDWSWGSTRNLAATSPVASGTRSLAVTFQAWGGVYFRRTAGSVAGMATLELSANGGTAAGNRVEVRAVQGSTELSNVMLATYCTGGTIPANAWTRCRIPLSALAPAGGTIDGIILQSIDGTARPTMYLDDVALTGTGTTPPPPALPPAPTSLAATVSSGAVSLSWTAVPGATGYDVSRATASAGPFTKLTSTPQAAVTYRDTSVAAGSTYWYQVAAVNAAGSGPASAAISASVPAAPPSTVTVTVAPAASTIDACTAVQLSATVAGASDGSVTWMVQEGAAGGTVDATGRYTAPSTAGTYHVVATSKASTSASASATVVVRDHILSIAINPGSSALSVGGSQQFTALVTTTCGTFTAAAQ